MHKVKACLQSPACCGLDMLKRSPTQMSEKFIQIHAVHVFVVILSSTYMAVDMARKVVCSVINELHHVPDFIYTEIEPRRWEIGERMSTRTATLNPLSSK